MKVEYINLLPEEFNQRIKHAPVAYLPLGTLEWHGPHLPLGTDCLISSGFFKMIAAEAGGILLPPLFLGPDLFLSKNGKSYYGMDIYGFPDRYPEQLAGSAYYVEDSLFHQILFKTLELLKRAGFLVVVAHGHGPSTHYFRNHLDNLESETGLKLICCWEDEGSGDMEIMNDHGGSNETSLMLAINDSLVDMKRINNGEIRGVTGLNTKSESTKEKGLEILRVQRQKMVKIIGNILSGL